MGSSNLAIELLKKQRAKADAHTREFYATHTQGYFEAFRMTRTRVPNPEQYIGQTYKKLFEDDNWYTGEVIEYHDDVQRWKCLYEDGDGEDLTCAEMKKYLGPRFVCGAMRSSSYSAPTASTIRAANRNRRLHGRRDPLDGVVAELQDISTGAEFELPAHYVKCAGTRWRLLRVYLEEESGRQVAAYCAADEAASIPDEDIASLSLNELEREYDVDVAEYSTVQEWVLASTATSTAVASFAGARRSKRVKRTA